MHLRYRNNVIQQHRLPRGASLSATGVKPRRPLPQPAAQKERMDVFAGLSPAPSPLFVYPRGWQQPHAPDLAWRWSHSKLASVTFGGNSPICSLSTSPCSRQTHTATGIDRVPRRGTVPRHPPRTAASGEHLRGHEPPQSFPSETPSGISKRWAKTPFLLKSALVYAQFPDPTAPALGPPKTPLWISQNDGILHQRGELFCVS